VPDSGPRVVTGTTPWNQGFAYRRSGSQVKKNYNRAGGPIEKSKGGPLTGKKEPESQTKKGRWRQKREERERE